MLSFGTLSGSRPIGFGGSGPIPWHRVIEFADYHSLDRELTDVLIAVVQKLDNRYLEWQREQADKNK